MSGGFNDQNHYTKAVSHLLIIIYVIHNTVYKKDTSHKLHMVITPLWN